MPGSQRTTRMSGIVPRRIRKSFGKLRRRRSSGISKKDIPDIQLTQSNVTCDTSIASSATPSPSGSCFLDVDHLPDFDHVRTDTGYFSDSTTTEGGPPYTTEEESLLLNTEDEPSYIAEEESLLLDNVNATTGETVSESPAIEESNILGRETVSEEKPTYIAEEEPLLLGDSSATIGETESESCSIEESNFLGREAASEEDLLEPIETELSLLDELSGPESPSETFEDDEEVSSTTSITAVHNTRFVVPVSVRTLLTSPTSIPHSAELNGTEEESIGSPTNVALSSDPQSSVGPVEGEDILPPTNIEVICSEDSVSLSESTDVAFSSKMSILSEEFGGDEDICSADEGSSSTADVVALHNLDPVPPVDAETMLVSPTPTVCSCTEESVSIPAAIHTALSTDDQSVIEQVEDSDLSLPTSNSSKLTSSDNLVSLSDTEDMVFSLNTEEVDEEEDLSSTSNATALRDGSFVPPVAVKTILASPTSISTSAVEENMSDSTDLSTDIENVLEQVDGEGASSPIRGKATYNERCVSFSDTKDVMFSPNTIVRVAEKESVCGTNPFDSLSPMGTDRHNENTRSIFRDLNDDSEIVYEDIENDEDSEEGEDLVKIIFTPSEELAELVETEETEETVMDECVDCEETEEDAMASTVHTEEIPEIKSEKTRTFTPDETLHVQELQKDQRQHDPSLMVWKLISLFFFIATVVLFGQQIMGSRNDQLLKVEAQRRAIMKKKKVNFLQAQHNPMGVWLKK